MTKTKLTMKGFPKWAAALILIFAPLWAETWTGMLVDVACADRQKNEACTPTPSTTTFALKTSGRILRFDSAGNQKAAEAVHRSGPNANREADPNLREAGVMATVTGTLAGDQIRVNSIQLD